MTLAIQNPTKMGIRSDPAGDGHYLAKRGTRLHAGIDFLCEPGQPVYSPIAGYVTRHAYPYTNDYHFRGIVIQGSWCRIKLLYVIPKLYFGIIVSAGEIIATAQDISSKYPNQGMLPHVHCEFEEIVPNPEFFLEGINHV